MKIRQTVSFFGNAFIKRLDTIKAWNEWCQASVCMMRLFLVVCVIAAAEGAPRYSLARSLASQNNVEKEIPARGMQKILSSTEQKGIQVGIKVLSLGTGKVIFESNPDVALRPASNTKLVTTLAALKYLGPHYQFKTKVYIDGPIQKQTVRGNLYIKGFGDPKLVSEEIWFLTNELQRKGFRHVAGNLILDDSFFDEKRTVQDPTRGGGGNFREERAYDALLGALSVNFNTTTVYVSPAKKSGLKPKVTIDPDNTYIKVVNKATTLVPGASGGKMTLSVSRVPGRSGDTIIVSGGIPMGDLEKRFYRNISHPREYAAAFFRRFFKERGITIEGKNLYSAVPPPPEAKEILVYESKPLRTIVSDLNRISNNFVAEQILKTLAAELKGVPGTTDKGLEILRDFLKELGITERYHLVNGSGLSPQNVMTAAQLVEVLKYGYQHFELFPEYMGSMGIVGVDGTVEERLKSTIVQGRVRAKTGSLNGVSALSGYLNTVKNEILAFSMIMNDPLDRALLMQDLQDEMLLALCHLE